MLITTLIRNPVTKWSEWSATRLGRLTPGETVPVTHEITGMAGSTVELDFSEKIRINVSPPPSGIEQLFLGHPACRGVVSMPVLLSWIANLNTT